MSAVLIPVLTPSETTSSERGLAPIAANDNVPRGGNQHLHLAVNNTLTSMTYHPSGALASMIYGNGQAFTQTLNPRLLPDHTRSAYGTNIAMDMAYTYDTRGKVTSVVNTAITGDDRAYSYDALGRLLTASGAWGDGSYTYDALGNIRNKTVGGIELLMSYDSSNRLVSHTYTDVGDGDTGGGTGGTTDPDPGPNDPVDDGSGDGTNGDNDDAAGNGDECPGGFLIGLVCYPDFGGPTLPPGGLPGGGLPPPPGGDLDPFVSVPFSAGSSATGPRTLSYDSRGNVTALGGLFFTYDMSDQPTAISGNGPNGMVSGTYTYDGNLKRVRSIVDGKTIYNVYDAGGTLIHIHKLAEGLTPEEKTDYIGKVARITTSNGVDTITYLHNDHLGSANTGTDQFGNVLWREQYTPFGSTLTSPLANNDLAGFTGHIKDSATGLNYMQARYYDPLIGRFLSRDPIGFSIERPEMFGSYTYVGNDPINGTDPTGMATCADKNCDTSTIDDTITRGAPPVDSSLAGNPNSDSASVSFVNDNANNPSPNQPVATHTARAVEGAIRDSNVNSVNINSTTGGNRTGGNHPLGQAVDINKVDGQSVLSQGASSAVTSLQDSFAQQPTARENFGPSQNTVSTRTYSNVAATTRQAGAGIVSAHTNHVHLATHATPSRALPVPRIKP